jgi:hypothetical protein
MNQIFAILWNCSNKFFGRIEKIEYFAVDTKLDG